MRSGVAQGIANERGDLVGIVPDWELALLRKVWQRCENPKSYQYKEYGKRGIQVCERWRASFDNFLRDMGPRPSAKHSIDRINNDGNYEPTNCRWATWREQANNRRVFFTVYGRGAEEAIRRFIEADAKWKAEHGG